MGDALQNEHDVEIVDLLKTPYWTDFKSRIPFYVPKGFPTSVQCLAKKSGKKYDLVVECSGAGQHHLAGFGKYPAPCVHWTVDDHEAVKRNFEMAIKKDFDMIFVCHKDYLDSYRDRPSFWLPPACDPALHKKLNLPKIYDIGFVGNLDKRVYRERVETLEKLSKKFKVGLFHKVYGEDMVKILNQSKIIFHKSFNHDLSTRVFDALSCGSFLLADRIRDGMTDLFEDRKHLVLYDSLADLEEKIAYYLSHEEEREKIAAEGRKEVLEKHTFRHRAQFILKQSSAIKKI